MKSLVFLSLVIIYGLSTAAQTKVKIISKDTINLRGYIYDANGKPCIAEVTSQSKDLVFNTRFISTITDTSGYFELKGALANDTLSLFTRNGPIRRYYNRGARYLIINLPTSPRVDTIPNYYGQKSGIIVEAVRLYQRPIPSFKILPVPEKHDLAFYDGENVAEFPGGILRFDSYVKEHLKYPIQAIENNIEGQVEAQFTITKKGAVTDVKIIRGIGYGCDEELVDILKNSPKWKPYIFLGRPLSTVKVVEIAFKLKEK